LQVKHAALFGHPARPPAGKSLAAFFFIRALAMVELVAIQRMGAAAVAREPDVGSAARAGLCFTVVVAGRKIMEQFPEREEDSWFSEAQMDAVVRADETDRLHSPFPTAMVSNGEYMPFAQTPKQKEVEARLADKADEASHMLGISRRRFLARPIHAKKLTEQYDA
jgi:hypothetical protein